MRSVLPSANYTANGASGSRGALSVATTAFFSSTPSQAILKNILGLGDRKERMTAAASELSSLNEGKQEASSSADEKTAAAAAKAAPAPRAPGANPHFSSGPPPGEPVPENASGRTGGIINIRSLPRRLPGRGGFPGTGVSGLETGRPRIQTNPAFQQNEGSLGRGRGGGRGRGRGGALRRRRDRDGELETEEEKLKRLAEREKKLAEKYVMSPELELYEQERKLGVYSDFTPALTLEGLQGSRPIVASKHGDGAGSVSAALRSMRVMGGGFAYGGGEDEGESNTKASTNPLLAIEQLRAGKAVYFDTKTERELAEKALRSTRAKRRLKKLGLPNTPMLVPISDAAKEAILSDAVRGMHTAPSSVSKNPSKTRSLMEMVHRYQLKDAAQTEDFRRKFNAKVLELLPEADKKMYKGGVKA